LGQGPEHYRAGSRCALHASRDSSALSDVADGRVETREVAETTVAFAYFLPDTLEISGDVQTQTLHRGIYDAAVFRGMINVSGKFPVPDMAALKIDPRMCFGKTRRSLWR